MRTAIIGSGPVGMTAALLLARRGVEVTLVDRDPGPVAGHEWQRVGVMQFRLPHGFRAQVRAVLEERLPDVYAALLAAGARVAVASGAPPEAAMLAVRRSVFERVLWERVSAEPGIVRLVGHADRIVAEDGRAVGVVVGSRTVSADLVLDASGRASRLTAAYRPAGERVDCGVAYAAREFRLLPGAEPGPSTGGPVYVTEHAGFMSFVFVGDAGTFIVLVVRRSDDRDLAELRHEPVFEAACRVLPGIDEWTDPARSRPVGPVRAGAGLVNAYTPQPVGVSGLLAIGDAFCVTNPQGARGVTLGMQCAAYVADLVTGTPPGSWAADLDAWGQTRLRPWYDDHVAWDHTQLRRWAGLPVEAGGPIGVDVLVAASQVRPELGAALAPFWGMAIGPEALDPTRELVRDMLRSGWQPADPGGITRDQLVDVVRSVRQPPLASAAG